MLYRTLSLKIVFILLLSLLMCYCGNTHETHYQVTSEFFHKVKNEDYDGAKSMLYLEVNPYGTLLDGNLKKLHKLLIKYEVPDFDKWSIEYDTLTIVKRVVYTVPMFKGFDQSNNLKEANVVIDFEIGGMHVGNLIMSFSVNTHYSGIY